MALPSDPDEFLIAFHRAHPGCTSTAMARGRCDDGRSSYDVIADAVPRDARRVLDLGCGDGYLLEEIVRRGHEPDTLVGVDMSDGELEAARARPALDGVELVLARAQDLPVDDGSVSCVVSHMAFMLMSDVEAVVAEIARALEPGGAFATVVGGGPRAGDAYELFLAEFQRLYSDCTDRVAPIGDKRCRSEEGLAELFSSEDFAGAPSVRDHYVHLDGTLDQVWLSLSSMYQVELLSAAAKAELRQRYERVVAPITSSDGRVLCTMAIRFVRVERA